MHGCLRLIFEIYPSKLFAYKIISVRADRFSNTVITGVINERSFTTCRTGDLIWRDENEQVKIFTYEHTF